MKIKCYACEFEATKFSIDEWMPGKFRWPKPHCDTHFKRYCDVVDEAVEITREDYLARMSMEAL